MFQLNDNSINDVNYGSKSSNYTDCLDINNNESDESSSFYGHLKKIESIFNSLEEENSNYKLELENNIRTISKLTESNSYLKKQKEKHDSIETLKALCLSFECISSLYNEVLDNFEHGHILRDNVETMIEDFENKIKKTGIILDYYKRGHVIEQSSNTSDRPVQTTEKKPEILKIIIK